MKIQINEKSYKLKPASELTVKEYIKLFSLINEKSGQIQILMAYICSISGINYSEAQKINIDENTIRRAFAYIGEINTPDNIPKVDYFYIKKTGKRIWKSTLNWRSLGVRKLLEDRTYDNSLDLAIYLLAIYCDGNYDNENIQEIYNDLQDYRANDVFGFVVFFLQKLSNGKKSEPNYLKKLLTKASINTAKLLNKLQAIA